MPYLIFLLGVFFISRALYDQIGITFSSDTYQSFWQFIHPSLLKTDLWRSIFFLHNQPPVLNVLTGVILQIFPAHTREAFHFLYYLAGLLLAVSIYFLGVDLGLPGLISSIVAVIFTISPSTIIYEHWLMYSYLIAAALSFSGMALHRFVKSRELQWGFLFFFVLACITLMWTLFHFVWMLIIFILTLYLVQDRRKVMMAALIPFLMVFGWYAKNLVVFGDFTAGSWGGMNLSHMTTFRLPENEHQKMINNGELSEFAAYPPFRNPKVYLRLLPNTPATGIPVLDITEFSNGIVNYHHQVYINASKYYLLDALYVLRARPDVYLRSVAQSLYIFFHSSSDFKLISEIRLPINTFDVLWNRVFYGQWLNDESSSERTARMSLRHVGWGIVALFIISVWGSASYLWKNPDVLRKPEGFLILFMLFNIVFVTIVGNSMDLGENNRFRYVIDSFILLLAIRVIYRYVFAVYDSRQLFRSADNHHQKQTHFYTTFTMKS
jgi:hypothetical protein